MYFHMREQRGGAVGAGRRLRRCTTVTVLHCQAHKNSQREKAFTTASPPLNCEETRTPCPARALRLRLSGCASARSFASRIAKAQAAHSAQTSALRPAHATRSSRQAQARCARLPAEAHLELRRNCPEKEEELQLVVQRNPAGRARSLSATSLVTTGGCGVGARAHHASAASNSSSADVSSACSTQYASHCKLSSLLPLWMALSEECVGYTTAAKKLRANA